MNKSNFGLAKFMIKVVLTGLLLPNMAHSNETQLVFSQTPLGHKFTCAQDALIRVYQNLNIQAKFVTFPGKRSLVAANTGEVDGEMLRVEGLEIQYPNLIRVPVAICAVQSIVIANKDIKTESFKDLRQYTNGITRGYVDQENIVETFSLNSISVSRHDILQDMLFKNRVDAIFSTDLEGKKVFKKQTGRPLYIQPALTRMIYLYHYLHKKNEHLLSLVTQQLRNMQKKGEIQLASRRQ